jgi:hypothetical protein
MHNLELFRQSRLSDANEANCPIKKNGRTLQCSQRFLTELWTFIPRVCCIKAVGAAEALALAKREGTAPSIDRGPRVENAPRGLLGRSVLTESERVRSRDAMVVLL